MSSKYEVALRAMTACAPPDSAEFAGNSTVPSRSVSRQPDRSRGEEAGFWITMYSSSRTAK